MEFALFFEFFQFKKLNIRFLGLFNELKNPVSS